MEKKLFIGIKIVPSKKLIAIYQELKTDLDNEKIKWVTPENLHITLKFLGSTPDIQIPEVKKAIKEISDHFKPFNFGIKGLGCFTKGGKIKVIWMGIDNGSELNAFADNLIKRFELIGYEDEKRKFTAHLTLGRVNLVSNMDQLEKLLSDNKEIFIQQVAVKEIVLFESITEYDGPHYRVIDTFSLIE